MANPAATETPANQTAPPPKKGRKLLLLIVFGLLITIGAGGGYYYLQQSKAAAQSKPERDRRTRANDEEAKDGDEQANDEEQPPKNKPDPRTSALALPDDSAVKQVIELQPFIVNLADKDEARYLRLTVSLGLGEVFEEKPNPLFITRLRNALLAVLTSRTSDEVLTLEGKAKLRKDLLRAARNASPEPKIEAIYITEFIVQL
jgi:flagellar protein FliL